MSFTQSWSQVPGVDGADRSGLVGYSQPGWDTHGPVCSPPPSLRLSESCEQAPDWEGALRAHSIAPALGNLDELFLARLQHLLSNPVRPEVCSEGWDCVKQMHCCFPGPWYAGSQ